MIYKAGSILKICAVSDNVDSLKVPDLDDVIKSTAISKKDDNFVYAWTRAITADVANQNGDLFERAELEKSYRSFVGRNLFLDHNASSVANAVGKVFDSRFLHDPKTGQFYVGCLIGVDKTTHPDIAAKLKSGVIDSVSMGASVAEAHCPVCNCCATSAEEFCEHLKNLGRYDVKTGKINISINRGVMFTELSLVSVPADPTAKIQKLLSADTNMVKTANKVLTLEEKLSIMSESSLKDILLNYKHTMSDLTSCATVEKIASITKKDRLIDVVTILASRIYNTANVEDINKLNKDIDNKMTEDTSESKCTNSVEAASLNPAYAIWVIDVTAESPEEAEKLRSIFSTGNLTKSLGVVRDVLELSEGVFVVKIPASTYEEAESKLRNALDKELSKSKEEDIKESSMNVEKHEEKVNTVETFAESLLAAFRKVANPMPAPAPMASPVAENVVEAKAEDKPEVKDDKEPAKDRKNADILKDILKLLGDLKKSEKAEEGKGENEAEDLKLIEEISKKVKSLMPEKEDKKPEDKKPEDKKEPKEDKPADKLEDKFPPKEDKPEPMKDKKPEVVMPFKASDLQAVFIRKEPISASAWLILHKGKKIASAPLGVLFGEALPTKLPGADTEEFGNKLVTAIATKGNVRATHFEVAAKYAPCYPSQSKFNTPPVSSHDKSPNKVKVETDEKVEKPVGKSAEVKTEVVVKAEKAETDALVAPNDAPKVKEEVNTAQDASGHDKAKNKADATTDIKISAEEYAALLKVKADFEDHLTKAAEDRVKVELTAKAELAKKLATDMLEKGSIILNDTYRANEVAAGKSDEEALRVAAEKTIEDQAKIIMAMDDNSVKTLAAGVAKLEKKASVKTSVIQNPIRISAEKADVHEFQELIDNMD